MPWDPQVVDKDYVSTYLYYEILVQKFIKQIPPAECSACSEAAGLYSGEKKLS
jgi:hypothetical protein